MCLQFARMEYYTYIDLLHSVWKSFEFSHNWILDHTRTHSVCFQIQCFPCSWTFLAISGLWSYCIFKMFELYFCLQWSFQNSDSCKIHQKRRKRVSNIKVESWMRTTKSSFSSWETCAVSGTLSEELSKSPRTAQKRVVVRSSKSSKTCWSFSQLCNLRDLQGREAEAGEEEKVVVLKEK